MICLFFLCSMLVAAADREMTSPALFPQTPPFFDKGYLIARPQPSNRFTLFGRDGAQMFETSIVIPGRPNPSITRFAIDTGDRIAVGLAWQTGGGIAFVDMTGKLTSFVDLGRYMPSKICFDTNHDLWAFGWQRDELVPANASATDYFQVRKFSKDGRPLGAFLPRGMFPRGLQPGNGVGILAAAKDRIGMMAEPGMEGGHYEWIELDLDGNLIGRWELGGFTGGGWAFTADGRLYTIMQQDGNSRLMIFDRSRSEWRPSLTALPGDDYRRAGSLVGADGEDLVVWMTPPVSLAWFRPE